MKKKTIIFAGQAVRLTIIITLVMNSFYLFMQLH